MAKPVRLSPARQTGGLYEMSMRFRADTGLASLDETLKQAGFQEMPRAAGAATVRIAQTVPFIPDDDTIRKYEAIVGQAESAGGVSLSGAVFDGYDYIYAVKDPGAPFDPAACEAALGRICGSGILPCGDGCGGCPARAVLDALERHKATRTAGTGKGPSKDESPPTAV